MAQFAERNQQLIDQYAGRAAREACDQSKMVVVEIRNVYGSNLLYPVNGIAREFATLLQVKTFNRSQVESMKRLGYTVGQVVHEVIL